METIVPRLEWSLGFLAVAEHGSFTAAANYLGCSKAQVSKQVAQLEAQLRVKLILRTTRRVQLTDAGEAYRQYCARLRDTLDEAGRVVSSFKDRVTGRIRISVPTSYGIQFMDGFLLQFHRKYPDLEIDLDLSIDQRDLLSGRYDLALRFSPEVSNHLIAKPLGGFEDWIVCTPRFAQQLGQLTHPSQLESVPCLANAHFADDHLWSFTKGNEKATIRAAHWVRINNYPMIRKAVLAQLGVGRLPTFLVNHDIREGRLVRLLAPWSLNPRPVFLVFPDLKPLPNKLRVTVDFFQQWYLSTVNQDSGP